jgi:hypothetical protein
MIEFSVALAPTPKIGSLQTTRFSPFFSFFAVR